MLGAGCVVWLVAGAFCFVLFGGGGEGGAVVCLFFKEELSIPYRPHIWHDIYQAWFLICPQLHKNWLSLFATLPQSLLLQQSSGAGSLQLFQLRVPLYSRALLCWWRSKWPVSWAETPSFYEHAHTQQSSLFTVHNDLCPPALLPSSLARFTHTQLALTSAKKGKESAKFILHWYK